MLKQLSGESIYRLRVEALLTGLELKQKEAALQMLMTIFAFK
jgi:hypothetical protein